MSNRGFLKAHLALVLLCVPLVTQDSAKRTTKQDFSKEGAVVEQMVTRVVFQSDGTSTREQRARVRVQSEAGAQQYGVLRFPYQASVERVEVPDVRVTKTNGVVVATTPDSIQDVNSDISREAPLYSDSREKHVAVKGLEPGDTLEYSVRWQLEKPLAPGQFWFGYQFVKNAIILDEQLEIIVPREREVKLKSQTIQPTTREETSRRIYMWKTSNLESRSAEIQKEVQRYDAIRGLLPPPDVLISSFRTWEEVGRWYESLQQEKIQPSPELKAKAGELTKGLSDDDAKLRAIYNYVSLHYRYVGIDFGIGRYQPHSAAEILGNQYGDCKDKHTLLAALLSGIGIRAYPALINSHMAVDEDVPSPGQFNHVISVVAKGSTLSWMDTTPEVTAIGHLLYPLRGKPALVITADKVAFQTTPANPAFVNKGNLTVTAKIDAEGTLQAHSESRYRGDDEFSLRLAFLRWPESQWKDLVQQRISYAAHLGATISNVQANPSETVEPFSMAYDYTLKDYSEGDKHRFIVPLPPFNLPELKDEDLKRKTPLWLGFAGERQYESRVNLPQGFYAQLPASLSLKETFAEFEGSSEVQHGVLVTTRRLLLKASAVMPDQLRSYRAFQKAISDDYATYISASQDQAAIVSAPATASSPAATSSSALPARTISEVAPTNFSIGKFASFVVSDGRSIWVAIDSDNTITRLRASDGAVLGSFDVGEDPRGIALAGDCLWVADLGDNTVRKLRASDGSALGLYHVGRSPIGITFDRANVWVANSGSNNVTKLRASDGTMLAEVAVGTAPYAIAFDGVNIWITNQRSDTVTKVDARTDAVLGTFPVGAGPMGITFDGANVWVANSDSNSVTKLRASDGTVLGTFPVGIAPRDVAFDGMSVWVANNGSDTVTKLRATDGALQGNFIVGGGPRHLVFDGSHMWVSTGGNIISRF